MNIQRAVIQPVFNSKRFLEIRQMAFRYFMSERLNYGINPTVNNLLEYLSFYVNPNEMPTLPTVARWHSAWKRSN